MAALLKDPRLANISYPLPMISCPIYIRPETPLAPHNCGRKRGGTVVEVPPWLNRQLSHKEPSMQLKREGGLALRSQECGTRIL